MSPENGVAGVLFALGSALSAGAALDGSLGITPAGGAASAVWFGLLAIAAFIDGIGNE